MIGSSGLHRIDWQSRKFEIGYWVRSAFARQGYITEAVDAITKYAIQELQANRIEIRCDSRNVQSARIAERSGFTLEGTLRNDKCDVTGTLRHTMIFAKVRGVEYGGSEFPIVPSYNNEKSRRRLHNSVCFLDYPDYGVGIPPLAFSVSPLM